MLISTRGRGLGGVKKQLKLIIGDGVGKGFQKMEVMKDPSWSVKCKYILFIEERTFCYLFLLLMMSNIAVEERNKLQN